MGLPALAQHLDRRSFLALCASVPLLNFQNRSADRSVAGRPDVVTVTKTVVFAAAPGGGNPCPVVTGSGLSDSNMQAISKHFGQDSAFLLPPEHGADLRIRYFVPDHEMGISGHATIAAVTVALQGRLISASRIEVETITGTFGATSERKGSKYLVTLEQGSPVFGKATQHEEVANALRIDRSSIDLRRFPLECVSVSRPKLVVPLRSKAVLDSLKPDYEALWSLCDRTGAGGLYPFALSDDGDAGRPWARQFPLRAGFPEDPATGVAAAALGAYLTRYALGSATSEHRFAVAQGYAMGAPSEISVITECSNNAISRVAIRGSASILGQESLELNHL